jgi:hypothetical protein
LKVAFLIWDEKKAKPVEETDIDFPLEFSGFGSYPEPKKMEREKCQYLGRQKGRSKKQKAIKA